MNLAPKAWRGEETMHMNLAPKAWGGEETMLTQEEAVDAWVVSRVEQDRRLESGLRERVTPHVSAGRERIRKHTMCERGAGQERVHLTYERQNNVTYRDRRERRNKGTTLCMSDRELYYSRDY
jgi:hypothetical protein